MLADESSMLSNFQLERFLNTANALGIRKVVFLGDTKQIQSLKAGSPFRLLQKYEMATAHMDQIIRQKNETLRTAVTHISQAKIKDAFSVLSRIYKPAQWTPPWRRPRHMWSIWSMAGR